MATLYSDLLMDPVTGDLDVSSGLQLIQSNQISLRQRLWMRFNVWQGDWYFDETLGFPYRAYISKKVMKTILDNKIKQVTRMEPDVLDITDFNSVMNVSSRSYQAFFQVLTQENEIVNIAFIGSDDYFYPTPDDGATTLCGEDNEDGWLTWRNKLYYLINFRLPSYGDATWINQWSGTDMSNPVVPGSLMTQNGDVVTTRDGKSINTSK